MPSIWSIEKIFQKVVILIAKISASLFPACPRWLLKLDLPETPYYVNFTYVSAAFHLHNNILLFQLWIY